MKKVILLILTVILAVLLVSCDEKVEPTTEPTEAPTVEPTTVLTEAPTEAPTEAHTEAPTAEPTATPTAEPTEEPTSAPTEAPTAEPTAEPTDDPSIPRVTVSIAAGDEFTSSAGSVSVPVGGSAVFYLTFERGFAFDYCDDPFATYENGKLTLPEVYFDTAITVYAKADEKFALRLNYPSDDIGNVHAITQTGYEVGQYLKTDTTSEAMERYYMYGSEVITFSAAAKEGYKFTGWSNGKYVTHGGTVFSTEPTLTLSVSADLKGDTYIYANFEKATPIKVVYHANGGATSDGKETYEINYAHPVYNYASTLGADLFNIFSRDGYVPIEYNTKADGSGTAISIGSKATVPGNTVDLYIIWAKESDAADFECESFGAGLIVMNYTGSDETVVIPEKINGKKIMAIGFEAFSGVSGVKTVVITRNITSVEESAFSNMPDLETLYMCDKVEKIYNNSFENCPKLANLRMIAVLRPVSASSYLGSFTQKYELLFKYADLDVAVFLGGSSMDEGFDGEYTYGALGEKYMPINLGLNRQITTVAMVEMLSHILDDGDIVVMAPELVGAYVDQSANLNVSRWMWQAIESCYDVFRYIDIRDYTVFDGYVQMMSYTNKASLNKNNNVQTYDYFMATGTDLTNQTTISLSHGAAMDKYGNRVTLRFLAPTAPMESRNHVASERSMPSYIANKLNASNSVLVSRGVRLFFSFCPMSEVKVAFTEKDSDAFVAYLNKVLDFDVLGSPMRYVFADELTNNRSVHLSTAGATERCRRLCEDILAALEK